MSALDWTGLDWLLAHLVMFVRVDGGQNEDASDDVNTVRPHLLH